MKLVFLAMRFFAADAAIATGGTVVEMKPDPTSPELDALKAKFQTAWQEMGKHSDPFSKEAKDAKLAVWKIENEMNAELARLKKAEADAALQEKRNERLKLNQTQLDAYLAFKMAPKNTPADKLAELETAFITAREAVDNELLAKYAGSKSARPAKEGDEKAPKSDANTDAIVELYKQGRTHKEIEELGYKRSTVWHAINNYKKANA